MKNLLLLIVTLSIGLFGFSQQRAIISKSLRDYSEKRIFDPANYEPVNIENTFNPTVHSKATALDESMIGTTVYDLQSNSLLQNRISFYEDGTIGAVWTMGFTSPSFAGRGTGYNFFDGNNWQPDPTNRIESLRTGWPSYAPFGENGEVVVSHDFAVGKLIGCTREQKGQGVWNETTIDAPVNQKISWARMITSGDNNNTMHLLCITWPTANGGTPYMGMDPALLYSRSTDGGTTWDPENTILEGTGSDYYNSISADEYVWAEPVGETIAFVVADTWHDWFVMKSTDNGDTWEKIMVWENPYPFFDWDVTITTDTMWAPDNSADIAIDADGMVHVVCGLTRVAHFEVGNTYSYWPWTDGIAYWNETMPAFENANQHDALDAVDVLIEDYNLIGWTQDVNGNGTIDLLDELQSYRELGISTLPNITIDNNNCIFVIFTSTTETYGNGTLNYKHIWARGSADNGTTWTEDFLDINTDLIHIFDECFYPVLAGNTDENIHLLYQADDTPGTALDEDHPYQENRMYYASIFKKEIIPDVGVKENKLTQNNVSQNFPNPFNNTSIVKVTLEYAADLSMEVFNLMGQKVYEVSAGDVNAGTYPLTIDASELHSGIYFYTVKAGEKSVTKKMIVK